MPPPCLGTLCTQSRGRGSGGAGGQACRLDPGIVCGRGVSMYVKVPPGFCVRFGMVLACGGFGWGLDLAC